MRVAVWSASLGLTSSNRAALEVAARWLTNAGAQVTWVAGLEQIPPFRADQADAPPAAIAEFCSQIEVADAVLIAAPEYAGGLAGVAKNALDWLVGSGSLYHRLAAVISVGTTGGVHAREQLIRTLSWQGAITIAELGVDAARTKMTNGVFTDPATLAAIEAWAAEAVLAHRLSPEQRIVKATELLEPLGINSARFGQAGG